MNKNIFSECLSKTQNLELGPLQLRYFGDKNIPSLLTIYELLYPTHIALNSLNENIEELKTYKLGKGAIKGLFVLGLSNFEIFLSDLLLRFLSFYPQKLVQVKDDDPKKDNIEYYLSKEKLFSGEILESFIKSKLDKLFYSDIEKILRTFFLVFGISTKMTNVDYSKLIEIKESRNLLLHNNLIVNEKYLRKAGDLKRAQDIGKKISINKQYALTSLIFLKELISEIENLILTKYSKYTLLSLLDRLWKYTFAEHIKMEDYFVINKEKDIYDGPIGKGRFEISSSETLFLQIWIAQRFGRGIDNFALVHLTPDNSRKVAFLTEVFGNLRFTYW